MWLQVVSLLCNKKLVKNNFTVQNILHMLRQYINTMNWMIEVQVFTESAPRVIQSISCDVHLLWKGCGPLRFRPEPRELETSGQRAYR